MLRLAHDQHMTWTIVYVNKKKSWYKTCSCRPVIFVHGQNDESTIFLEVSFSIFGPLRHPLASLQIMFNPLKSANYYVIWIIKRYRTFVISSIDENYWTTWTSLIKKILCHCFNSISAKTTLFNRTKNTIKASTYYWYTIHNESIYF